MLQSSWPAADVPLTVQCHQGAGGFHNLDIDTAMNIYTIFEASEDICKQGLRVQKFRISANISYFV